MNKDDHVRLHSVSCVLLDMDGTFYLGDQLLPGALELIDFLHNTGKTHLFLTNNSSHSASHYVKKLRSLGLAPKEEDIFTAGQATAMYLQREHFGKRVFLLGNEDLQDEMRSFGVNLDENDPEVLCVGFDTTLTYDRLCIACNLLREGLPSIATHPDFNCPTQSGFVPDIGAILAFLKASTGRDADVIVGKPHGEIVRGVLARTGLAKEQLLMVGDRLYTDIATGKNHGILSALVLTGETHQEDVVGSAVQPDFIFEGLPALQLALQR